MFDILPPELKSVAVRTKVRYAPHPYVWMSPAHVRSTGLGIESGGLELAVEELPAWTEKDVKTYPMVSYRILWLPSKLRLTISEDVEEPSNGQTSLSSPSWLREGVLR